MRTEGVTALYKGIGPALLRAFPANGVSTCIIMIYIWQHYIM